MKFKERVFKRKRKGKNVRAKSRIEYLYKNEISHFPSSMY